MKRVQFGDGYAQESPDGLNRFPEEWMITWENLLVTELQTAITAFKTVGGVDHFTWTTPYGASSQKFRLTSEGWSVRPNSGSNYTLSAKFVEWFE